MGAYSMSEPTLSCLEDRMAAGSFENSEAPVAGVELDDDAAALGLESFPQAGASVKATRMGRDRRASFTSSSLNGLMMAVTSFIPRYLRGGRRWRERTAIALLPLSASRRRPDRATRRRDPGPWPTGTARSRGSRPTRTRP